MRATGKIYDRERLCDWPLLLTVVAVIAIPQTGTADDDITGTVSQTAPVISQNSTPTHPMRMPANAWTALT
jgi:hypothetical protein